ncbi:hypothetical protein PMAYCL1PPCAC_11537 [Pristionchus mayeri]|uniref:C2H2-type domain-containing protein n=1 Tax=Pristionchus mayeri TaxID=1317129 RepID=A0AAN5CF13_9BILA|nr:hypothetical protein PMAYCL1PPCAC_11537 [Pristionchus mayeri]
MSCNTSRVYLNDSGRMKMGIDLNSFKLEDRVLERYDIVKLAFFINFITSPHILIQLPFGEAKVQDSHGNIHYVTNAIRQTGLYETIAMYEAYMKENKMESLLLKRTTMYNILAYLPIKKAVSMQCVDMYQADATNAFIEISRMLDSLVEMAFLDKEDAAHLKRQFEETKLYLKGNYRLHVKKESLYSDHCLFWGLSDPDHSHFAVSDEEHTHKHQQRCPDCKAMDDVINNVKALLKKFSEKTGLSYDVQKKVDGYVHDFNLQSEKIYELKQHYARAVYASMEYERIIGSVEDDQATLLFDFAQKWEATQYRESQPDYYGKAGTSMHVIHVSAKISGRAVSHQLVHILPNAEQDSTTVVAIAEHALHQLHMMGIKKVHIRSDYHSSALVASMPSISTNTKVTVLSYSFSEKQAGKGLADRDIGKDKRKMRSERDKQHKVITADDMFEALNAPKQLRGTSIYLATVVEKKTSTTKIPKITRLSHFEYRGKESARVWQFHGIGEGKDIHHLNPTVAHLVITKQGGKLASAEVNKEDRKRIAAAVKNPFSDYDEPTFWNLPREKNPLEQEVNDKDDDIVRPNNPDPMSPAGAQHKSLFYCSECGASFIRHSNLISHLTTGNHKIRPIRVKLLDRVLGLFSRAIEETLAHIPFSPISEVLKAFKRSPEPELKKGWAIGFGRKTMRYPEGTKMFVKNRFEEYARRGAKLRAEEAERLMRADRQILPSEWMTKTQLKNYINTLKNQMPKLRVWRRSLDDDEEEDDEHHVEMEVPPQEEDLRYTEEDIYNSLDEKTLEKFFTHVKDPIRSPIPEGATEFD